jgi:hypothetical protein
MDNVFKTFCIAITEKLNILRIGKGDASAIVEDSYPENVPRIKIITITETEL